MTSSTFIDEADLHAYLDGDLDPEMRRVMAAHLGDCKPCEAFLASLEESIARCRRFCPEEKLRAGEALRSALLRACGAGR